MCHSPLFFALHPGDNAMNLDNQIFEHPAKVLTVAETGDLLALVKQSHALDAASLTEYPPFFFRAEISSDRLDSYFTRMHETSLVNYAQDAATGISFQNSHNHHEMGFGRSLTGLFVPGEDVDTVLADFYTVRGLTLNGINTDHLITGIRTGLVKDVSIGFYGGEYICSICGRDLWDWDCTHVPGFKYAPPDEKGNKGEEELAFAWVRDAHLAEVSAVYDGATPGAAILKAQQESEAGRLSPEKARILESRYRIALPGKRQQWAGANLSQEESMTKDTKNEKDMQDPQEEERFAVLQRMESALESVAGANVEAKLAGLLAERTSTAQRVKDLAGEVATLKPLAEDGHTYRADLVSTALAEGVRAYGGTFDEATYRKLLEASDLTVVKRLRDDWTLIAEGRFPGGRQTKDGHDAGAVSTEATIPAAAYRA